MPTLARPPIEAMPNHGFTSGPRTPLNLKVWNSWADQGRAAEHRRAATRLKAVKFLSGFLVLLSCFWWPMAEPYASFVRFAVSAGSLVVMLRAFREGHTAAPVFFAAMALLFNPIIPVFPFAGEWMRWLMIASAIPFFAALGWRKGTVR